MFAQQYQIVFVYQLNLKQKTNKHNDMKEVIEELNKKFHYYCDIERDYQIAMDALAELEFDNKQTVIDGLRQRRNKADKTMKNYYRAVQALQKVCPHKLEDGRSAFYDTGNDSHYDYETCKICGFKMGT